MFVVCCFFSLLPIYCSYIIEEIEADSKSKTSPSFFCLLLLPATSASTDAAKVSARSAQPVDTRTERERACANCAMLIHFCRALVNLLTPIAKIVPSSAPLVWQWVSLTRPHVCAEEICFTPMSTEPALPAQRAPTVPPKMDSLFQNFSPNPVIGVQVPTVTRFLRATKATEDSTQKISPGSDVAPPTKQPTRLSAAESM